jgi:hypothetical protein
MCLIYPCFSSFVFRDRLCLRINAEATHPKIPTSQPLSQLYFLPSVSCYLITSINVTGSLAFSSRASGHRITRWFFSYHQVDGPFLLLVAVAYPTILPQSLIWKLIDWLASLLIPTNGIHQN